MDATKMPEWKDEVAITFEGDYVKVISDGRKSFERAEWLWSNVAGTCRKHSCFNVVGIARSTAPVQVLEGYDHARLFKQVGITDEYRIAWVELNREVVGTFQFMENLLVNRGFDVKLFADSEDARRWVVGDP